MSRFSAPFILKVSFYDQSKDVKNKGRNAAHINYIGTRSGVDLGEVDLSENTVEQLEEEPNLESAAGHVKYAEERPGSHGLFDGEGIPSLVEVQNELKEHEGVVWRMILSLKEEDANKLGFDERQKWEDTLRASVSNAASKMGIKESNLRWVAAFHQEQGHPHVHLVMWEKEPKRTKGLLSEGEKKDVKRAFMREIYADERTRLNVEKTANRDLMRDLAKGDMQKFVSLIKEIKSQEKDVERELRSAGYVQSGIAPKLFKEDEKEIIKQLNELSEMLPTSGRIAFKFMPEPVKEKSLSLADSILQNPSFREALEGYLKSVEEMAELHTLNREAISKSKDNAYNDLQKRMANLILRSAAEINQKNYLEVDQRIVDKHKQAFLLADGKPQQDLEKEIIESTVKHLRVYGMNENQIQNVFEKWLPQINSTKTEEEVNQIITGSFTKQTVNLSTGEENPFEEEVVNFERYLKNQSDFQNPYEKIEYLSSTLITKGQIFHLMNREDLQIEDDPQDIAVTLNAALKESGATFGERKEILEDWAIRNELTVDFDSANRESNKITHLQKEEWEKVCEGLNVSKEDFNWKVEEKELLRLDHLKEITQEIVKDFTDTKQPIAEYEEYFKKFMTFSILKQAKTETQLINQIEKLNSNLSPEMQVTETELKALVDFWKKNDLNQIKIFSSVLTSAGFSRQEIVDHLQVSGVSEEIREVISDHVRSTHVNLQHDRFISFNEFNKVKEMIEGKKLEYPYSKEEEIIVNHDKMKSLINEFKNAKFLEGSDIKSTTVWMNKILLRGGVEEFSKRKEILEEWAKKNNIHETEEFKNADIKDNKKYFINKAKFEEVCKTLCIEDQKIPWQDKVKFTLENNKVEDILNKIQRNFDIGKITSEQEITEMKDIFVKVVKLSATSTEDFRNKLDLIMKKLPVEERFTSEEIKIHETNLTKNNFLKFNEFKKVKDILEVAKVSYPYQNEKIISVNPEDTKELAAVFKNASLLEGSDIKETLKWMNQILLKGGIEEYQERKSIIEHWAKNNHIHDTEEFKTTELKDQKDYFVDKARFDEICKTLEIGKLKLPWENKSLLKVDPEKLEPIIEKATEKLNVLNVTDKNERLAIRDILVKSIRNIVTTNEEFHLKVNSIMDKLPPDERLTVNEIEQQANTLKREDFNYVQNALRVEDVTQKTIEHFTVVLKTTGLSDVETKDVIFQWKERTSLVIEDEKLNEIVNKSLTSFAENKGWGKVPFISKNQYELFCKNVNVNAPYLWKPQFANVNMLAQNIWKAISKAIDQEHAQTEAQNEMARKNIEKKQQIKVHRHHDRDEQER